MRKIGIMGGTFNPVHIGHLLLAQCALEEAKLDEVWLIPTGYSYMKSEVDMVPAGERFAMTKLAVADHPRMRCLDMEIRRSGYTYSYETFEQLKSEYPEDHFYFIFGADCLLSIEKWKCPERIFAACSILAATRGETSLQQMAEKQRELVDRYQADITLLPFRQLEISSTDIRHRVAEGKSIRYLVPDQVMAYIEEKGFYRHEG